MLVEKAVDTRQAILVSWAPSDLPKEYIQVQWGPFWVTPKPEPVRHKEKQLRQCSEAASSAAEHRLETQPHTAARGSPRSLQRTLLSEAGILGCCKKKDFRPGMVANSFDPSTQEADLAESL